MTAGKLFLFCYGPAVTSLGSTITPPHDSLLDSLVPRYETEEL